MLDLMKISNVCGIKSRGKEEREITQRRAQDTISAEYRRKQDTKAANGDKNIAKWDDRNDISDNGRCNRN